MADFDNGFWSVYIGLVTVVSLLACALFLWATSSRRVPGGRTDTTGHVWDETLAEYNNPLPRWWMWLFMITIVFGFGYLAFYPGLGAFAGVSGWTSAGQYDSEMKAADAQYGPIFQKFAALPVEQLAQDRQARAIGERLFLNTCAQCHGSDAHGGKGFPNLTDNDWLYGGAPAEIETTIANGRHGVMPPLAAAVGSPAEVRNLAQYVLSLSGSATDPAAAEKGKEKFALCAACHGAGGEGSTAVGAPRLNDKIWLYGGGLDNVVAAINNGHEGVMPAHKDLLGAAKVHLLAAYVWSLSNAAAPAAAK